MQEHLNKSIVLCGDCKHWRHYKSDTAGWCRKIVGGKPRSYPVRAAIARTLPGGEVLLMTDSDFGCVDGES